MKKFLHDYSLLIMTALLIIALDQGTKTIIRQNLEMFEIWVPFGYDWLYPYVYIIHWFNKGAAFGIFQNGSMVFTILAIIVSILIIYYFPRIAKEQWALRLALGLQLGGAVGNLIDRLTIGHVTDFVAIGEFPVFNVADASITVGVFILIIGMWFSEKEKTTQSEQIQDE